MKSVLSMYAVRLFVALFSALGVSASEEFFPSERVKSTGHL
jgi:hypothetical protein